MTRNKPYIKILTKVFIGFCIGCILFIFNSFSLDFLKDCEFQGFMNTGEWFLDFDVEYFTPILFFLFINTLLYYMAMNKKSNWKLSATVAELILIVGIIWYLLTFPVLLNSMISTILDKICAIIYYFELLLDIISPLFFFIKLIKSLMRNTVSE